jgi:hypothetical protein
MISLCSGCAHYYNFNCEKSMDDKAIVRACDHFRFIATKNYRTEKHFLKTVALLDFWKPVINPKTS